MCGRYFLCWKYSYQLNEQQSLTNSEGIFESLPCMATRSRYKKVFLIEVCWLNCTPSKQIWRLLQATTTFSLQCPEYKKIFKVAVPPSHFQRKPSSLINRQPLRTSLTDDSVCSSSHPGIGWQQISPLIHVTQSVFSPLLILSESKAQCPPSLSATCPPLTPSAPLFNRTSMEDFVLGERETARETERET